MKSRSIYSLIVLSAVVCGLLAFSFPSKKVLDDEKYKVIKVNGQILIRKSGKALSQGDEFLSSTALDFKTSDSRAAVISPTKGRFVLTAQAETGKTNLVPGMNNISSRGGALLNFIDLQNHFSGNYVILEEVRQKISKESYPMSDKNFFFLQYEYKGEKINKKLFYSGDTLILNRGTIFSVDNKPVEATEQLNCTMFYRKSEQNENFRINAFVAVFPKLNELKSELNIILDQTTSKKTSEKVDELLGYMTEFYGSTDKEALLLWGKQNLNLK